MWLTRLDGTTGKASSQWLNSVNEPYIYAESNPIHHAKGFNEFHGICHALKKINAASFKDENDPNLTTKKCWPYVKAPSSTTRIPESSNLNNVYKSKPLEQAALFNKLIYDQFSDPRQHGFLQYKLCAAQLVDFCDSLALSLN